MYRQQFLNDATRAGMGLGTGKELIGREITGASFLTPHMSPPIPASELPQAL